jgi:hypothetical protein
MIGVAFELLDDQKGDGGPQNLLWADAQRRQKRGRRADQRSNERNELSQPCKNTEHNGRGCVDDSHRDAGHRTDQQHGDDLTEQPLA